MAGQVDCELVTFGPRPATWRYDVGLRIRVLRPVTRLHGHPAQPVAPLLPAALTRAQVVHAHHFWSVPTRMSAVTAPRPRGGHGGHQTRRFTPMPGADPEGVLFVGPLTSHKGIDRLIRALPAGAGSRPTRSVALSERFARLVRTTA